MTTGQPFPPVSSTRKGVRRLIHTTNAIEGFNRQLRKVTKSKTVFPTDDSLLRMLYLATVDITKKWTGHRQGWGKSIPSWESILKNVWQEETSKII